MTTIRHPCVAGTFYPADPAHLRAQIAACYEQRAPGAPPSGQIKALIAPHAGYVYSGPIAASAYAAIAAQAGHIRRVVLAGPAHRFPFNGIAICDAEQLATPLGSVPVDHESYSRILGLPQVQRLDVAFDGEHCLEVQLPFLQELLPDFMVVPLLVGNATAAQVAEVVERLWDGDDSLILISSDLSHYLDDSSAQRLDARTSAAILSLEANAIGPDQACGRLPIAGLLQVAKERGLKAEQLDLRNSSATAGPADRVVGYGAYVFH